jgi:hypothetical protein
MRALLALLLLLPLPAFAQDILDRSLIRGLVAGILCAPEVIGTTPAPDTVAGVTNLIEELPPFVSESRMVPAVIGIGFAVAVEPTVDLPAVRIEVTHPPMGPERTTVETYPSAHFVDGGSFAMYQFEYDYELVEGPWVVAAFSDTQPLWSVTFQVVAPELVPELAAPCGFEALLS